ncbi:hypothetical protein COV11_04480, partial [Candidatus Woesearchaeota archaeon CG10_big_fil_rev_8_21_14_0_10_30_7]
MEHIKNLEDIKEKDFCLAGGKATSLSKMMLIGISVPQGFSILTTAFEEFLKENNLKEEITSIFNKVKYTDISSVKTASQKIRSLILTAKISKKIEQEIIKHFKQLNSKFVAVRSSATTEDSQTAAWAGQLETYLNTTEKTLLENIKKCWASLFTPRAIFYSFEKKFDKQKISVGVIIQKMIQSETSGVGFSIHPVTGNGTQILIESCFGLGEALVSGQVTPDRYIVEKNIWKILDKQHNKKPKLSDQEIIQLSKLINKLEIYFGFFVDVEWVKTKNKFYIVQSRPVTTLTELKDFPRQFEKFYNRPVPLTCIQYWWIAEYKKLPLLINNATHFNPLFIHKKNSAVDLYYDINNEKTGLLPLINYFKNNPKKFFKLSKKYQKDCDKLKEICKNKNVENFSKMYELLVNDIWPMLTITILLGRLIEENGIIKKIAKTSYELRQKNEKVAYATSDAMYEISRKKFPKLKDKYLDYLTFEEINSGNLPPMNELKKRVNNFIYFEGKIYTNKTIEEIEKENNITIMEENVESKQDKKIIKGNTAMNGKVKGKVKLLFELSQIKN